ncbi:MAG: gamma-glutamyl-gamma-aminobutyrate hydrolase family protein [Clostridia bacterium]|nr:gamma-glutamyl-gamma-aminobutyrate hydrolase family protein [Clostridia bacterium]
MRILLLAKQKIENYAKAVASCGAETVLNCPDYTCDGLVVCGGNDIDPSYYGEEIKGSRNIDIERDKTEFEITKKFIETGKPILGICRGHQLINILLGGNLIQHLPNASVHTQINGEDNVHTLKANPKSVLFNLYGDYFFVNSSHHQAINQLGNGLIPTAFSMDGVIEATEHVSKPYITVQFHPERMNTDKTENGIEIFRYFIDLCKKI